MLLLKKSFTGIMQVEYIITLVANITIVENARLFFALGRKLSLKAIELAKFVVDKREVLE